MYQANQPDAPFGDDPAAPEQWRLRARCRDSEPATFFNFSDDPAAPLAAKEICSLCPVRRECLAYALMTRQPYGVWGGMTATERRRLLRRNLHGIVASPR
ncbi:MAG TPA: WhiB family transcriptional regulator [Acidimicrobiia bacterium]